MREINLEINLEINQCFCLTMFNVCVAQEKTIIATSIVNSNGHLKAVYEWAEDYEILEMFFYY